MSLTAPIAAPAEPATELRQVPVSTRTTLLLVSSLTVMSGAIISPALPEMRAHFADIAGADVLVRLVLTILGLSIALSAPLSGWLSDRYGRRPVLIGALLLYGLAGSSGLYAPSLATLLLGRVALGLAVGATMTAGAALVADLFGAGARTQFLGVQSAFGNLGGAVFLPLGGVLASLTWRAPFAVYLVALLLLPLAGRLPRTRPTAPTRSGPSEPFPWRLSLPLYLLALGYMLQFYLMPVQLPFRLTELGVQPAAVGLVQGLVTLAAFAGALGLARRGQGVRRPLLVAGAGLLAQSLGWVLVGYADHLPLLIAGLLLGGVGGGLVLPLVSSRLGGLAPALSRGRVMSGLTSAIFLGQFLSPLVAQPLVASGGVALAFRTIGMVGALAGLALILGTRRSPDSSQM